MRTGGDAFFDCRLSGTSDTSEFEVIIPHPCLHGDVAVL